MINKTLHTLQRLNIINKKHFRCMLERGHFECQHDRHKQVSYNAHLVPVQVALEVRQRSVARLFASRQWRQTRTAGNRRINQTLHLHSPNQCVT